MCPLRQDLLKEHDTRYSFLIGGVSGVLPICKLFGLFNAKYLYIGSIILFMAGSALCGAAPTTEAFIVGRVIAGLGGNGMYMGTLTLLSVTTNDKERPMYIGLTYVFVTHIHSVKILMLGRV